jgi:hypothetical protein
MEGSDIMIKRLTLVILLAAVVVSSAEGSIYRGKRGRRNCKRTNLVLKFRNDKLKVYNEYGFPIHRIRVRGYGRVLEHWTYYEAGKEFIFDQDHKLVKVNRFWPEDRRARIESYNRRKIRNPRY